MATQKVHTGATSRISGGISAPITKSSKNIFYRVIHVSVSIFLTISFIFVWAFLFVKTNGQYGYHKTGGGLQWSGVFAVILFVLSYMAAIISFLFYKLGQSKQSQANTLMVKHTLLSCVVILYVFLNGIIASSGDYWLFRSNGNLSTGGINVLCWGLFFIFYSVWCVVRFFKGEQIYAWWNRITHRKHK